MSSLGLSSQVHLWFAIGEDPRAANTGPVTSQSFLFLLHKVGLIMPDLTIFPRAGKTPGKGVWETASSIQKQGIVGALVTMQLKPPKLPFGTSYYL